MIFNAVAVSPAELAELRRHPERVLDVIFPDDVERRPESVDLDKTWHGLHYLLNGDPWEGEWPLCGAILGGEPIGEDTGYGPPRYLTVDQVADIAAALNEVCITDLEAQYDAAAMDKERIYPHGWEPSSEESLGWLLDGFNRLVLFYGKAAAADRAVLLCLS